MNRCVHEWAFESTRTDITFARSYDNLMIIGHVSIIATFATCFLRTRPPRWVLNIVNNDCSPANLTVPACLGKSLARLGQFHVIEIHPVDVNVGSHVIFISAFLTLHLKAMVQIFWDLGDFATLGCDKMMRVNRKKRLWIEFEGRWKARRDLYPLIHGCSECIQCVPRIFPADALANLAFAVLIHSFFARIWTTFSCRERAKGTRACCAFKFAFSFFKDIFSLSSSAIFALWDDRPAKIWNCERDVCRLLFLVCIHYLHVRMHLYVHTLTWRGARAFMSLFFLSMSLSRPTNNSGQTQ